MRLSLSTSSKDALSSFPPPSLDGRPQEEQESTPSWIQSFLKSCARDPQQVAVDLLHATSARSRGYPRTSLESMAHRILQEILLANTKADDDENATAKTVNPPNIRMDDYYEFESPYESSATSFFNAEVGEGAFDIWKRLVSISPAKDDDGHACRSARYLFGPGLADQLVDADQDIQTSVELYNPSWRNLLEIPDHLRLLLLPSARMARADCHILNNIVQEFGLEPILRQALKDWGLEDEFPKLKLLQQQTTTTTTTIRSTTNYSSRVCHCLLFVARAYKCMYALQWTGIRGTLAFRVIRCLQILSDDEDEFTNTSIRDGSNPKQARTRKEREEVATVKQKANASVLNCTQQAKLDNPETVWKKSEIVQMPVEKFCLKTGDLLERYKNAAAAQQSVSESTRMDRIYDVLVGRGRYGRENPRLYMGFFWRLQGSSHVPAMTTSNAGRKRPAKRRGS
jgi:hypothetical protein